jgi:hypothetical protein
LDDRLNRVAGTSVTDLRVLSRSLARYREPNHERSVVEILITVVPFFGLCSLMWLALHIGYGLYLLLAIPTAGFLVRLFMIQHEPVVGRDKAPARKPTNSALFARHREISVYMGLRGGAGRTRTSNQTVISRQL